MGHFRTHYFLNRMIILRQSRLPKGLDKIFLKSRIPAFHERNSRNGTAPLRDYNLIGAGTSNHTEISEDASVERGRRSCTAKDLFEISSE